MFGDEEFFVLDAVDRDNARASSFQLEAVPARRRPDVENSLTANFRQFRI